MQSGQSMHGKHFFESATWTLIDQCVVSGGNFLLNVLLARVLSKEDYGEFALFLGAIFLLRAIDYSLISYPVSVRLGFVKSDERATLLGTTALLAVALSLVLVVLMGLGTAVLAEENILLPACLCYLCWQVQETSRRFLLADFRYRAAVAGDGIAYVGQVLLITVVLWIDSITLSSVLYAMSATFVVGALVHSLKLRFAWPHPAEIRRLAVEYLSVGKWSLVSYELVLIRGQLFPWLLAALSGIAATASLQAGLNIANTMNPIIFGIGNAIPQVAAHANRSDGVVAASRAASRYMLFGLGPILVICAIGLLIPDLLLLTAYGPSSPYLAIVVGLQILVVAGVLDYIAEMISKTLLGIEAGKLAFLVNIVAVAMALVLALTFIGPMGVVGACLALLIANLVRAGGAVIAIVWLIASEKASKVRPASDSDTAAPNRVDGALAERRGNLNEAPYPG
jgi:O-antigen/teichoic acid export membrane protein